MQSLQAIHTCILYGITIIRNLAQVWLVMEYIEGGDLFHFLIKNKAPLPKVLHDCIQIDIYSTFRSFNFLFAFKQQKQ
jgi:hypothetical protein